MIAPESAQAHPKALEAIRQADLVVIGPGSLYTSVLPNLMIRGMSEAVTSSDAVVVYLCNVATEVGETAGYTVADHLAALQRHTRVDIADYVMANDKPVQFGTRFDGEPVVHDGKPLEARGDPPGRPRGRSAPDPAPLRQAGRRRHGRA